MKNIVIVNVFDHSRLGGSMGSETTSLLDTLVATNKEQAVKLAVAWLQQHSLCQLDPKNWKSLSVSEKIRRLGDVGAFGFTFQVKLG